MCGVGLAPWDFEFPGLTWQVLAAVAAARVLRAALHHSKCRFYMHAVTQVLHPPPPPLSLSLSLSLSISLSLALSHSLVLSHSLSLSRSRSLSDFLSNFL